jgi:para-nitrobenzyl esterase
VAALLPDAHVPGEDYLNLNVWTPGLAGARPVMVFIHGGSFTGGSGAISVYDGTGAGPGRWGDVARNIMPFEPVVDGQVLPCPPAEALRAGAAAGTDVLIGTNADEANLFFVPAGAVTSADRRALAAFTRARGYPPSVADAYRAARPAAADGELMSAIMTDGFYRVPALEVARARPGTYVYEFAWRSPAFGGALGACHAIELPFVFDNLADPGYAALLGADPPQPVADAVHRAWCAFASSGDPGWPAYDDHGRYVRRFSAPGRPAADDGRPGGLAAWDGWW